MLRNAASNPQGCSVLIIQCVHEQSWKAYGTHCNKPVLLICIYELDIRKYLVDKILISNKLFPWTQTYQISAKKKKKKRKKVETSVLFFQTLSTATSLGNLPRRCAQSHPRPCAVWIPSTLAVRLRNNLCPFPPQCWCSALTGTKPGMRVKREAFGTGACSGQAGAGLCHSSCCVEVAPFLL